MNEKRNFQREVEKKAYDLYVQTTTTLKGKGRSLK